MCGVGTVPPATPPPPKVRSFHPRSPARMSTIFGGRWLGAWPDGSDPVCHSTGTFGPTGITRGTANSMIPSTISARLGIGHTSWVLAQRAEGLEYRSRLIVGSSLPIIGGILNFFVNRFLFSSAVMERWIRHNVEEMGNLEVFLPALYTQRDAEEFRLSL